jgi:hypothetical protein
MNMIAVRAELVETQESIHILTSSTRTDYWIKRAGSIDKAMNISQARLAT